MRQVHKGPNLEWRFLLLSGPAGSTVGAFLAVSLWSLAIVGFAALAAVLIGWLPEAW